MGKKLTNTNIPVIFQKVSQFDSRFMQVKIWLMHLGENYNGSVFTKESVERAIPSLKNTPILGYINEENAIGKQDYAGHEMKLVVEDGEYKFKYLGSAYGVIPETNNARWETKRGDDGVEREYLVVDGLMWTKFDDAIGILDRDEFKGQSMELHDDYDGEYDENGFFVFDKFSFNGACILGDGHDPAMQRATIEKTFTADILNKEVHTMVEEFKKNFGKFNEKEGNDMTLEELLAKYSVTSEQLEAKGIVASEFSIEDLEAKIKEEFAQADDEDNAEPDVNHESGSGSDDDEDDSDSSQGDPDGDFSSSEDDSTPDGQNEPDGQFGSSNDEQNPDKVYHKFALAHDDIRNQLWDKVNDFVESNQLGERWDFWISKVYDDHVIIQDEYNGKLFKVDYTKDNDAVALGSYVEVHAMYLTAEEKGALELMRNNYETLEAEVTSLREFKKESQRSEHEAQAQELFERFGLDEAEVKDLAENVHNFTIEEIEEKLFARVGRKNFSIEQPKPNKVALSLEGNKNTQTGKSYSHLFSKHGITK